MSISLKGFLKYLQEQVNNGSIYVWGAQGQIASEAFIKAHETGAHRTAALTLYRKRIKQGYDKRYIRCFDCSGLGMYYLKNKTGYYKIDKNANSMLRDCTLINKAQLKKGCWVFKRYKTGSKQAYHIGYVVDDNLNVIEAQGRAYGVVKRPLSKGGWNAYGIPKPFEKEIAAEFDGFTRVLKKGMKGRDVKELQKLLNYNGASITADGDFGSKTQKAVKAYQKSRKLKVDGIAGEKTITALGGKWIG